MGYYISLNENNFTIKKENVQGAVDAIKALHGKETCCGNFSWVDHDFHKLDSLEDILGAWRYGISFKDGDVCDIDFEGEKLGDDELLFSALAPFVEPESYLQYSGEEGHHWRWVFDGKTMVELDGKLVWEAV